MPDSAAPRAAVAAGHERTAEAALDALRAGGNAVDAAVAAVFMACVSEPVLTGPFGAGLMAWAPADGEPAFLDFFARVPGLGASPADPASLDFVGVSVDFGPATQRFHIGRGSAAVPGTLVGMFDAQSRWGRLDMATVVAPAVRAAQEGVVVSGRMAQMMRFLGGILVHTPAGRDLFAPGGDLLAEGELFTNPDLGRTLREVATSGVDGARRGALADRVVAAFGAPHGLLTHDDLACYQPVVRRPLAVRHGDDLVLLPPPPTAGGPLVAHSLAQLPGHVPPAGTREYVEMIAQSMACMNDARARVVPTPGSTTHVSVVDADGNAASVTTSNGESCGWVVPGTGIVMNNFLGEEDINPGGFHRQAPGEGMLTMMCPTVIRHGDGRTTVLGTGGSNRIRTAILQVVVALLETDMTVEEAVRAPRLHLEGSTLNVEAVDLPPGALDLLRVTYGDIVEFPEPNMFFGGVHSVRIGPDGTEGAGDPRRGGVFRLLH